MFTRSKKGKAWAVALAAVLLFKIMLEFPLSAQSIETLRQFLRTNLGDVMLDVAWNDYFYYRTVFEDVNQDLFSCTPGTGALCPASSVAPDGLVLNTEAAAINDFAEVEKTPLADSGLAWDKRQRMRIGFRPEFVAAQTIYMVRGSRNLTGPYYGAKIVNATLKGVSYDGTTETTVDIATLTAATSYVFEARYMPGENIVFLVDGVQIGVLNASLPNPSDATVRGFYDFYLRTDANVGKTLTIAFFEYIQKK